MKRIILIGVAPPPFNGQSVAFGLLIDRMKEEELPFKVIDMSYPELVKGGRSNIKRSLDFIYVFWDLVRSCYSGNFVAYLQMSQSKRGFLRDLFIHKIVRFFGGKMIVHLHGGNYDGFYHGQSNRLQKQIRRELFKYHSIIILSESLRYMFDFYPDIRKKLISIPNGIGNEISPVCEKVLPSKTGGQPVKILYLSNMIESKGYMRVLDAIDILNRKGFNIMVDFCGLFLNDGGSADNEWGRCKTEFFKRIKDYHLEEKVRYLGLVVGREKEQILSESHFFVLPTNYGNEGQPISIIEAMRHGCVVISTAYRAITDMVEEGVTGYLLQTGGPEEIAAKIEKGLTVDASLYSKMSRNAILKYNQKFTANAHTESLISFLKTAAS